LHPTPLGEGTLVVLGGEGDAWREVEEDRGLRCVWWGRRISTGHVQQAEEAEEVVKIYIIVLGVEA